MMLETLTNTESFKVIASVITGGAFVGWYREHRRGRKDVMTFTLQRMEQQAAELAAERMRVDQLVNRIANLERDHAMDRAGYREALAAKDITIAEQRAEIDRLKTELSHYAPRVVSEPTTQTDK